MQSPKDDHHPQKIAEKVPDKRCGRRDFIKQTARAAAGIGGAAMLSGCGADLTGSSEVFKLRFQEFFKKNYQLMTQAEKEATVNRLERLAKIKNKADVQISTQEPVENVLFGYGFNVTRCEGFMECVSACVKENNLDRRTQTDRKSVV